LSIKIMGIRGHGADADIAQAFAAVFAFGAFRQPDEFVVGDDLGVALHERVAVVHEVLGIVVVGVLEGFEDVLVFPA
jgi:hypothetical protein